MGGRVGGPAGVCVSVLLFRGRRPPWSRRHISSNTCVAQSLLDAVSLDHDHTSKHSRAPAIFKTQGLPASSQRKVDAPRIARSGCLKHVDAAMLIVWMEKIEKTQTKYPLREARTITVAACDKNIGCKETA